MQQKDGVRSLNQECLYGSSRRKRHEEYQSMVKDKVAEVEWKYLDVNEHCQEMKNIQRAVERLCVCNVSLSGLLCNFLNKFSSE